MSPREYTRIKKIESFQSKDECHKKHRDLVQWLLICDIRWNSCGTIKTLHYKLNREINAIYISFYWSTHECALMCFFLHSHMPLPFMKTVTHYLIDSEGSILQSPGIYITAACMKWMINAQFRQVTQYKCLYMASWHSPYAFLVLLQSPFALRDTM